MPNNPPDDMPRISPYRYYADAGAALEWLAKAFGFEESFRMAGADGKVMHAELRLADGVVMIGCPGPDYEGPGKPGYVHGDVYVYVDDVDAHYEQAKAAGAKITQEPADQFYGDRRYMAEDPEGQHWTFATHVKDVAPEDMQPPGG